MNSRHVEAAQIVDVIRSGAATRQTSHLRGDALMHAATVGHAALVGREAHGELARAQTVGEVRGSDPAAGVRTPVVEPSEDVRLVKVTEKQ